MSRKYKKHTLSDRLKYMQMLEEGYSSNYIHNQFGIDHTMIDSLWVLYKKGGPLALKKKQYIIADGSFREKVVRDIEENHLTLYEAVVKYGVSASSIFSWRRVAKKEGYAALYREKSRGRPPKDMGRPKKKRPEEMTELERLRYENECLRTENALLKKVRALVEERNARLREIGQKPSRN